MKIETDSKNDSWRNNYAMLLKYINDVSNINNMNNINQINDINNIDNISSTMLYHNVPSYHWKGERVKVTECVIVTLVCTQEMGHHVHFLYANHQLYIINH